MQCNLKYEFISYLALLPLCIRGPAPIFIIIYPASVYIPAGDLSPQYRAAPASNKRSRGGHGLQSARRATIYFTPWIKMKTAPRSPPYFILSPHLPLFSLNMLFTSPPIILFNTSEILAQLNIFSFSSYQIIEGMAHYAGQLLAPGKNFDQGFVWPFGQKVPNSKKNIK